MDRSIIFHGKINYFYGDFIWDVMDEKPLVMTVTVCELEAMAHRNSGFSH